LFVQQLRVLYAVKLTMEDAGRKLKMAGPFLLVLWVLNLMEIIQLTVFLLTYLIWLFLMWLIHWFSDGFQEDHSQGCKCPPGFKGDGVNSCEGTLPAFLCYCSNIILFSGMQFCGLNWIICNSSLNYYYYFKFQMKNFPQWR
jgi:hypothetical protein